MAVGDRILRQSRGARAGGAGGGEIAEGLWVLAEAMDRRTVRRRQEEQDRIALEFKQRAEDRAIRDQEIQEESLQAARKASAAKARQAAAEQAGDALWNQKILPVLEQERARFAVEGVPIEEQLQAISEWRTDIDASMKKLGIEDDTARYLRNKRLNPYMGTLLPERIEENRQRFESERSWNRTLEKDAAQEERDARKERDRIIKAKADLTKTELEIESKKLGIESTKLTIADKKRKAEEAEQDEVNALVDAQLTNETNGWVKTLFREYEANPDADFPQLEEDFNRVLERIEARATEASDDPQQGADTRANLEKAFAPEMKAYREAWGKNQRSLAKTEVIQAGVDAEIRIEAAADTIGHVNSTGADLSSAVQAVQVLRKRQDEGWKAQGLSDEERATRRKEADQAWAASIVSSRVASYHAEDSTGEMAMEGREAFERGEDPIIEMLLEDGSITREQVAAEFDEGDERAHAAWERKKEKDDAARVALDNERDEVVRLGFTKWLRDPTYSRQALERDLADEGIDPKRLGEVMDEVRQWSTDQRAEVNRRIELNPASGLLMREFKGRVQGQLSGQAIQQIRLQAFNAFTRFEISEDQLEDIDKTVDQRMLTLAEGMPDLIKRTESVFTTPMRNRITQDNGTWFIHNTNHHSVDALTSVIQEAEMRMNMAGGVDANPEMLRAEKSRLAFVEEFARLEVSGGDVNNLRDNADFADAVYAADAIWASAVNDKSSTVQEFLERVLPTEHYNRLEFRDGMIDKKASFDRLADDVEEEGGGEQLLRARQLILMSITRLAKAKGLGQVLAPPREVVDETGETAGRTPAPQRPQGQGQGTVQQQRVRQGAGYKATQKFLRGIGVPGI